MAPQPLIYVFATGRVNGNEFYVVSLQQAITNLKSGGTDFPVYENLVCHTICLPTFAASANKLKDLSQGR
jgi:hypothetical protein